MALQNLISSWHSLIDHKIKTIPGDVIAIDGSLIDTVFSMCWADYRKDSKKHNSIIGVAYEKVSQEQTVLH